MYLMFNNLHNLNEACDAICLIINCSTSQIAKLK